MRFMIALFLDRKYADFDGSVPVHEPVWSHAGCVG
jgi:hypothetical protein